ncbi:MAG: efflux RND transporter permease subunit, partial [Holophagales bacterium]|nr:efflux RND transporter permease subunit [Holophagales bacterium]
ARHRQRGAGGRRAAAAGTREVTLAITASTATTLAVFLPLSFVDGLAGRLFRDQSLAVVCALSASLFVALTAVPLIASRRRDGAAEAAREPRWMRLYPPALDACLERPRTVLLATVLVLSAAGWIGWQVPRQAVPAEPASRLAVELTLPAESALPLVAERARDLEQAIAAMPGVHQVLADLGERDSARLEVDPRPAHAGSLTVTLEPGAEAATLQQRVLALTWPGDVALQVTPVRSRLEALLLPGEADLFLDLECGENPRRAEVFTPVVEALAARPELINVGFASATDIAAFELSLRPDLVRRHGTDAATIGRRVETATAGRQATALRTIDRDVPIVLRTQTATSMPALLAERVETASGLLPLGTFFELDRIRLPAVLTRAGRTPVVRLHADLAPGVELERAVTAVRETVSTAAPGVSLDIGSSLQAYHRGAEAAAWSLVLSLLLVYLILAAQFESLLQPLTVLATVPPAIAGVALGLAATGQTWNLISMTGTVVLTGIAVNAAIVLVDFIARRQRAGLPLEQAIRDGARQRLRAVLITSSTTVLGMLPLALGLGDGGALRRPLAVAVIGGLILSTLSTLFVVPVVYRFHLRLARRLGRVGGSAVASPGSLHQEVS